MEPQPPHPLAYATPASRRKLANVPRATGCYALAQLLTIETLIQFQEPVFWPHVPEFAWMAGVGFVVFTGVATIGFTIAFLLFRPLATRIWPPVCAAVAGAATLGSWWGMSFVLGVLARRVVSIFSIVWIAIGWTSLVLIVVSFCTSSILLLVGKRIFERVHSR